MRKTIFISFVVMAVLIFSANPMWSSNVETKVTHYIDNNLISLSDYLNYREGDYEKIDAEKLPQKELNAFNKKMHGIYFTKNKFSWGIFTYKENRQNVGRESLIFEIERSRQDFSREEYELVGETMSQSLRGIFFEKEFLQEKDIDLGIGANLFQGLNINSRDYKSTVTARDNILYIEGYRRRVNSSMNEEKGEDFDAWGWGMNCRISFLLTSETEITFDLKNFFNRIYWSDIYTRIMEDQEGFYYYEDYITSLQPQYKIGLQRQNWKTGLHLGNSNAPYLLRIFEVYGMDIKLGIYDLNLLFALESDHLNLNLISSGVNPAEIKSLGIQLSLSYDF